jgi:hypothetical protein
MIQVKLDDKTIDFNRDLTIVKYQNIQRNPIKYNDPSEVLALYLDIDVNELKDLPKDQVKFIENYITEEIVLNDKQKVSLTFEHNGIVYGLENDWGKIKWGQWVDMEVFSQPDKINDNIHLLMSLLYRPVIKQKGTNYTIEPYKSSEVIKRSEIMKSVPVKYWFGCSTFFLLISHQLAENTKNSLELKLRLTKILNPILKRLPRFLHPKLLQDFTSN